MEMSLQPRASASRAGSVPTIGKCAQPDAPPPEDRRTHARYARLSPGAAWRYAAAVPVNLLNLFVIVMVVAAGVLLGVMTGALGTPMLKMVRSGQGVRVSQGLLLAVVLLAELAIVIWLVVVVSRL